MLYLVVAIAVVLLFVWELKQTYWNRLPGPTPYPFIGTVPYFVGKKEEEYLPFLSSLFEKYGNVFAIYGRWLAPDAIFTVDPQSVKHFLHTNFDNYERAFDNPRFSQLFGKGIFNSNGLRWKVHRKTARPMFSKTSISGMLPHFVAKAEKVASILDKIAESGKPVDIQDLFFRFTLDSIGEIGFGYSIDSLDKDVPFASAFNRSQYIVELNSRNPLLQKLPDKNFDEDMHTMHEFIREIIQQRKKDQSFKSKTDLLSRFMSLSDEETGEPFADDYLIDIIMNFFIAGRDTTACLLTWMTYLLSQNPQEEKRLVEAINAQFNGGVPETTQQLKEIPLLQNVLDETLRLYPPVPFDTRRSINADVLPDGTPVPAKTGLVYSAYILGRMEKYWKDAQRFNPDRFLHPEDINKDVFVPFHAGPQTCLGRAMAYLEAKTLTAVVLPRYHFELAPGQEVLPKIALVMPAIHGVKMLVSKRA